MRIVVTGATGNVGTSLVDALVADPRVREIVGIARRLPKLARPRTTWVQADVAQSPLVDLFRGADAVVHLAWLIQPSRHEAVTHRTNVTGSRRVFEAAAAAGVPALVYASSIGAYSPAPSDAPVTESWPTNGTPTAFYARHKAATERELDAIEAANPALRVVRLRPALIFKREAASGIRRLFAGPFLPSRLVDPSLIPVLPLPAGLRVQAVHAADIADAYRRAATDPAARGAYNVAADPVLDAAALGEALGARPIPVPPRAVRAAAWATWRLRLQPTEPGWLDMGMSVPVMVSEVSTPSASWASTARSVPLRISEAAKPDSGS